MTDTGVKAAAVSLRVPHAFPTSSSAAAPATITDVLLIDTDMATAMYGPSLREKYRVHTAGTWEAARQHLMRNPPALVITELALGGTSGVDVCRQAKALPVPSTVLVTTSDVSQVPDALEAGCDGVLLKPFAPNLLHARIGRLLRGRLTNLRPHPQARPVAGSVGYGYGGERVRRDQPGGRDRLGAHTRRWRWPERSCTRRTSTTVAGLREALVARDVIGQAKGILMATQDLDADGAFALLVRASQAQNVKLRKVAEEVARTDSFRNRRAKERALADGAAPLGVAVAQRGRVDAGGKDRGLRAALHAELGEQVRHVVLHRLLGEVHRFADLTIGETVGNVQEDATLLVGEPGETFVFFGFLSELATDTLDQRRIQQRLSGCDSADCVHDVVAAQLLEQVARCPGEHRLGERLVIGEGREHDAGDLGLTRTDLATDLDAIAVGEPHVEHGHLRSGRRDPRQRELCGAGLTDDLHVVLCVEELPQAAAHHFVVVEQEDPNRFRVGRHRCSVSSDQLVRS